MSMIELTDLSKSFGPVQVLKNVSFKIERGSVLGLIGPSGSGKSTLLRCINLLDTCESGTMKLDGTEVFAWNPRKKKNELKVNVYNLRQNFGMVFQDFNLFPHFTALQNVMEGPIQVKGASRSDASQFARQLLERVGLGHRLDYYPDELSGGQKQRVAIARSLAMRPTAMLFDEPTSALDPELVHEVLQVVRGLRDDGMTMIIATHEMDFARDISDQVAFMADGSVVEYGPPDQIFRHPQNSRTAKFLETVLNR